MIISQHAARTCSIVLAIHTMIDLMSLHDMRHHPPRFCAKLSIRHQDQLSATSQGLRAQEQSRVQKTYIARVLGSFPTEPVTVDKYLAWDSRSNHAFLMNQDGSLAEKQSLGSVPIPSQSQQLQAKEAQTGFRLLSVSPDDKTSLVECVPRTGRTHQIRC